MTSSAIPAAGDSVQPKDSGSLSIEIDGAHIAGLRGQTLAGVLLGSGRLSWRTTSTNARPRGVFCGIGVCFDCIAEVNGVRDVRLCQRRAVDGDVVAVQHDDLPVVGPHTAADSDEEVGA
ncbi:MAG: (2Fe-2S)-binding protein [Leifsonia flava]